MPADSKLPHVFRESFVRVFEQPEQQAALRVMDDAIHAVVWEGKGALDSPEGDAAPWFEREVRGAIGDLRQAIDNLALAGRWIDEAQLNREESRLSLFAGDTAAKLVPFADQLDAALSAYLIAPAE